MKVNVTKAGRYVPKWNENRELDSDEQMYATYDNLNEDERARFEPKTERQVRVDDVEHKSDEQFEADVKSKPATVVVSIKDSDDAGIMGAMNIKLFNLEKESGGSIDTWQALCRQPQTPENDLAQLVAELKRELPKTQEAPDLKN